MTTQPTGNGSPSEPVAAPNAEELLAEIAHLKLAVQARDIIGQAKGIIRLLSGADAEGAFDLLSKLSQDTNRKIGQVATVIADCAASKQPLPPDLAASWRRRTTNGEQGEPQLP